MLSFSSVYFLPPAGDNEHNTNSSSQLEIDTVTIVSLPGAGRQTDGQTHVNTIPTVRPTPGGSDVI